MKKPKRDKWAEAAIRAQSKTPEKYKAWILARKWVFFSEQLRAPTWSKENRRLLQNRVLMDTGNQILKAIKKSDATFLRYFADAAEQQGRPWSNERCWLVDKHEPDSNGKIPRFTHEQLLDDAESRGLGISDRQLRRLMSEFGFPFKNARQ